MNTLNVSPTDEINKVFTLAGYAVTNLHTRDIYLTRKLKPSERAQPGLTLSRAETAVRVKLFGLTLSRATITGAHIFTGAGNVSYLRVTITR